MNLAAIILSAGTSRRMGQPKALLLAGGETFLDRLIRVYSERFSPVIVVLGAEADAVRGGLCHPGAAQFVTNERWPLGQLTSLQRGMEALPSDAEGCFFTPVDCPRVTSETLAALAGAFGEISPPPLIVVPRHGARRGHPVGCSRELFAELLSLPPDESARAVLRGHPDRTRIVEVVDAGILDDVDTPEEYRRMETPLSS
jgi:molybdenum cofactor cytidylyltransferase